MDPSLIALWSFWGLALAAAAVLAGVGLTRPRALAQLLTSMEWKAAAKLVAILVLALVIIYFHNAHRYDAKGFIYGRF